MPFTVTNTLYVVTGTSPIDFNDTATLVQGSLTFNDPNTTAYATIDPGAIVQGYGSLVDYQYGSSYANIVDNKGTLNANAGGTLGVYLTGFTNDGLIEATTAGSAIEIEDDTGVAWTNTAAATISGSAGTTLTLGGDFTNAGTVVIDSGALNLNATSGYGYYVASFVNTGTITATNSAVNLRGNETAAQIGALSVTGGSLTYSQGTLDNTDGALGAATTSLHGVKLAGATIHGGTLDQAGLGLTFDGNANNDLDGVTVLGGLNASGTLALSGGTAVRTADGSALAEIDVTNGTLVFRGDAPTNLAQPVVLANATVVIDTSLASQTLTVTAAGEIDGYGSIRDRVYPFGGSMTLDNQGTINANSVNNTLFINAADFTNHGLLEVTADGAGLNIDDNDTRAWTNAADGTISGSAGSTLTLGGQFTNAGSVTADGGTLNLDATYNYGGSFQTFVNTGTITATDSNVVIRGNETVADLGALSVTGGQLSYASGTLDNTGGSLGAGTTVLRGLKLTGATIHGGTLDQAGLGLTFDGNSNNDLDGVNVLGGLAIANGQVALSGGTVVETADGSALAEIDVTNGTLDFRGDAATNIAQTVKFTNSTVVIDAPTQPGETLTVTSAGAIDGYGTIGDRFYPYRGAMTLVNQGTINANVVSQGIYVVSTAFTNDGLLEATAAGAQINVESNTTTAWTNAADGTILGTAGSTLELGGAFTNAGIITSTGGVLNLDASYSYGGAAGTFVNTGTITATNSTVTLRGNETVAAIGNLSVTGGELDYALGTLDNTGGALGAATTTLHGLKLTGATIHGGTLDQAGLGLTFDGNSHNDLDGVTVLGGLSITGGTLALTGGTVVETADGSAPAEIDVTSGTLVFRGDAPTDLAQTVALHGSTLAIDTSLAGETLTVTSAGLIEGSGYVGDRIYPFGGGMTLVNDGTIAANDSYQQLTIGATTFTNHGLLETAAYGATLSIDANQNIAWTNAADGIIAGLGHSTLELGGQATNLGAILADADATLNLDALYNYGGTAATFTNTGTVEAHGSTINQNGILAGTGSVTLDYGSTLNATGTIAGEQSIIFGLGTGSTLAISHADQFSATIAGFRYEDAIKVAGVTADGAVYTADAGSPTSGGILTLTEGGVAAATLNLQGDYTNATFDVASANGTATVGTSAGDIYDGALKLSGPSGYDYTAMFPALSQATSAALTSLGGGREAYTVTYANHEQVVFEGTGLVLGAGGQFDPAGGTVDTVIVSDTTIASAPLTLATFSSVGAAHQLAFAFNPGILVGGEAFYEQLLSGNNTVTGSPNDDFIEDDWGNNTLTGGGGNDTLIMGPTADVSSLTTIQLADGTTAIQATYNDPDGNIFSGIGNFFTFYDPVNHTHFGIPDNLFGGGDNNGGNTQKPPATNVPPGQAVDPNEPLFILPNPPRPTDLGSLYNPLLNPPPPQYPTGSGGAAKTDPHLTTFDGLYYDFQGVGEYVLAKSTVASDPFQIQIRTEAYGSSTSISVIDQSAIEVGTHRVTTDFGRANVVEVDGQAVTFTNGRYVFDDGSVISERSPTSVSVTLAGGETVFIDEWGANYQSVSAYLGPNFPAGKVVGLLGNDDGSTANDFALPDGTVLAQPLTAAELYRQFGDAWRVTDATSLLDYGQGQTTATFTNLNFPSQIVTLADLPADVVAQALATVRSAGISDPAAASQAALDLIVTGDFSAVLNIANTQQQGTSPSVTEAVPTGATTPSLLGIAPVASSVTESASGTTAVQFQVYRTGDMSNAATVDYAVVANGAGGFTAASFGGTLPSGEITIAAGAASATFTVQVPNAAVTAAHQQLGVSITSPDGLGLLAPGASSTLVNNQPVEGTPAQPGFQLVSGPGTLLHAGNAWTLDLGTIAPGAALPAVQIAVANLAATGADDLSGSFDLSGDGAIEVAGAGTFLRLLAGAIDTDIAVSGSNTAAGPHTETITLHPVESNATGFSAALPDVTLTVEFNNAAGTPTGTAVPTSVTPNSVTFTVTASEPLTNVDATDFAVVASGGVTGSVSAVSGSGQSYAVTISDINGTGSLSLALSGSSNIVDMGGVPFVLTGSGSVELHASVGGGAEVDSFGADGRVVHQTQFDTTGNQTYDAAIAYNPDGTNTQHVTIAGAAFASEDNTYGTGGLIHQTQFDAAGNTIYDAAITYPGDGSNVQHVVIPGAAFASEDNTYTAAGLTHQTQFDGQGGILLDNAITYNPDGSNTQHVTMPGAAFASEDDTYGAAGITHQTQFDAAGNTTYDAAITYTADGNVQHVTIPGAAFASEDNTYGAGGLIHQTQFDAAGNVTYDDAITYTADGNVQHVVIPGAAFASEDNTYTAAGLTHQTQFDAAGNTISDAAIAYNADGTNTQHVTVPGAAFASQDNTYGPGGLTQQTVAYPDGHATIQAYADGQVLAGTAGADAFTGFGSHDTFAFAAHFGNDSVAGFNPASQGGHDLIQVLSGVFANNDPLAAAQDVGADLVLHDAAQDTITLLGLHKADIASADFHFV